MKTTVNWLIPSVKIKSAKKNERFENLLMQANIQKKWWMGEHTFLDKNPQKPLSIKVAP